MLSSRRRRVRRLAILSAWFYNVQVNRNAKQVRAELRAILRTRPHVLGLVEATGYDLPDVEGYTLIRDRSNRSRANVAAYVRNDLRLVKKTTRWADSPHDWPRTKHPGTHEPRSTLSFVLAGWHVVIGHMPPTVPGAGTARLSVQWDLINLLDGPRPQLLLYDANPTKDGGTATDPPTLAKTVRGDVIGTRVDRALVVRGTSHGHSYPSIVGGLELRSDHGHALRVAVETQAYTAA